MRGVRESNAVQVALHEVDSWQEPHHWPRPFREVVHYAKLLAGEVHRLNGAMRFRVEGPPAVPTPPPLPPPSPVQALRLREVAKLLGISRGTVYKRMQDSAFPKPLRIGQRAVRWRLAEIEEWLRGRGKN